MVKPATPRVQVRPSADGLEVSPLSAADFLVRVWGAVDGLARDWKGVVSQHEIKALLSEVFINGVQEEFRHILNSEMARYGELTEEQMYNAVKRHGVYLGRTKCLRRGGSTSTTPRRVQLHRPPITCSNHDSKRLLLLWQLPWKSLILLQLIRVLMPQRSPPLTLIPPQRTFLASTFLIFLVRQMMQNGDSQ